jgi:hypothetical protein
MCRAPFQQTVRFWSRSGRLELRDISISLVAPVARTFSRVVWPYRWA